MTKYFVQTSQGGLYTLTTTDLETRLDPKEGLLGKQFLPVQSLTKESVYLNTAHIVSITLAQGADHTHE